jgi:hypothetical protein
VTDKRCYYRALPIEKIRGGFIVEFMRGVIVEFLRGVIIDNKNRCYY